MYPKGYKGEIVSREMKASMSGWSPIFDSVADEFGLVTAAVYGVVWRYCNMKSGRCFASQETLAKKVALKRRSMVKHLDTLVKYGYLKVYGERGRPNVYFLTGAADMNISITEVDTRLFDK